ncbi:MAG: hypothetical protein WAZ77_01445, partial [Candidatus Nitrosopolaris sp.]
CRYSLHLNLVAIGEECILYLIRDPRGAILTHLCRNDRTIFFCKYLAMATITQGRFYLCVVDLIVM